jgi:deoxyribodipyrimidine photo-lyase
MNITPLLSREHALQGLACALSRRLEYRAKRNYALDVPTTTLLSPFIRRRVLEEDEVLRAVLHDVGWNEVEKLVQEIVWRTYWKGWLEINPDVWSYYVSSLPGILERCTAEVAKGIDAVIQGTTSIECINDWSKELSSTGYLHNHKRMWFASIWIFTLKLPWELGAKFFLERLLDGDPASNTLSWRWVAGLQTKGKRYLATPENIAKFSHNKWDILPGTLVSEGKEHPIFLDEVTRSARTPQREVSYTATDQKTALLIHAEDLRPETLPIEFSKVSGVIIYRNTSMLNHQPSQLIVEAFASALDDVSLRIQSLLPGVPIIETDNFAAVDDFMGRYEIQRIIVPALFQGFLRDDLKEAFKRIRLKGIVVQEVEREYDTEFHPLARKGFFPFWEAAKKRVRRRYSNF